MKNFSRTNQTFSLCGLNCKLCSMYLGNYCPGCGGGEGNQSCAIARCSLTHEGVEYCFQCEEYPCAKYEGIDEYDSFITHKNQLKDMDKAKDMGIEAYNREQEEKAEILKFLLDNYNDGRKKNLFCIAVNLLELEELKQALLELEESLPGDDVTVKEKAALAAKIFQDMAKQRDIVLKLNKKPGKK